MRRIFFDFSSIGVEENTYIQNDHSSTSWKACGVGTLNTHTKEGLVLRIQCLSLSPSLKKYLACFDNMFGTKWEGNFRKIGIASVFIRGCQLEPSLRGTQRRGVAMSLKAKADLSSEFERMRRPLAHRTN